MANATTKLLVTGLLMVLPTSANHLKQGADSEKSVPDLVVYVEDSAQVPIMAMLRAKAMAVRMFAGIGVKLTWATRRPSRSAEPEAGGRKQPVTIWVRIEPTEAPPTVPGALAYAYPYATDGVRIKIFYRDLHEATYGRAGLEPPLLAHVLVHELTHVLQGVARHSPSGVMMAHWTPVEFGIMERRPLEFSADDAELVHLGLDKSQARASAEVVAAN